jgi:hypothetical protein
MSFKKERHGENKFPGTVFSLRKKRHTKGQITIFIILGLILLFAAVFVIQLTKEVRTGELEKEREGVIGKTFKKEALRIYVEGCLTSALEEGLELIGKQGGRIWKEQGGRTEFILGETGINLGDKISYAITNKSYLYDGQYPCEWGEEPNFCKYQHPNGSILPNHQVKFGGLELSTKIIEDDLKRFLIAETIKCVVEDLIGKQGLSPALEISTENLKADVNILNEGIQVKVDYPLTLGLAGEEFFHLAEFSFLYPSDFKKLLESAIVYPLSLDWSFVDFRYVDSSLTVDSFVTGAGKEFEQTIPIRKSEYNLLGIDFQWPTDLGNGNTLFIFNVGLGVLKTKPYTFQFVRQNRPPALDYIERNHCDEEEYDYLVILNYAEMGTVDIELSQDIDSENTFLALDPDEDKSIRFSFNDYESDVSALAYTTSLKSFFVEPTEANIGWHNITVTATDRYGAEDKQKVRILVDRSIKPAVSLDMPYRVLDVWGDQIVKSYEDAEFGGGYFISNEDPVFLNITLPEKSKVGELPSTIILSYDGEEISNFGTTYDDLDKEQCFNLPWHLVMAGDKEKQGTCNIIDYTLTEFKDGLNGLFSPFPSETTGTGTLGLNFVISYCGKEEQEESKEVLVKVMQCAPHRNTEYPFAWPYNMYKFDAVTGEFLVDEEEINPFLATHSCCNNFWTLKPAGTICFESPVPDCEGNIPLWTALGSTYAGYVLEQKRDYCTGERGNICGGEGEGDSVLWEGALKCGTDEDGCNKVDSDCENVLAWGYVDIDNDEIKDGWCHKMMGCDNVCLSAVVDKAPQLNLGSYVNLNNLAQNIRAIDDISLGFGCGCELNDEGKPCDDNFDGLFDKTCLGGSCR